MTPLNTTVRLVSSLLPDKRYSFVAVHLHSLVPTWCSQQAIRESSHLCVPHTLVTPSRDYARLIQIIQDSMEGITWQAGRDNIQFQEWEYRLLWKAILILQALNAYFFSARI